MNTRTNLTTKTLALTALATLLMVPATGATEVRDVEVSPLEQAILDLGFDIQTGVVDGGAFPLVGFLLPGCTPGPQSYITSFGLITDTQGVYWDGSTLVLGVTYTVYDLYTYNIPLGGGRCAPAVMPMYQYSYQTDVPIAGVGGTPVGTPINI
ncbi:MAG: hypothetical protein ACPGQL_08960 [Thermoplasmatota archaeon]